MTDNLYHNDIWTLDDELGVTRTGDQVARMALEVDTPFTIGVIGKWGAGKTSILRRAFVTLDGNPLSQTLPIGELRENESDDARWQRLRWYDDNHKRRKSLDWSDTIQTTAKNSVSIWYSPWQHQTADNPLVPLLLEIRAQFGMVEKLKETNKHGFMAGLAMLRDVAEAGIKIVGKAATPLGLDLKPGTALSELGKNYQAYRNQTFGDDLTGHSDGQRLHLLFEAAIDTLLTDDGRLIIFIDDLDRCEENAVVNLLEGIKLYLNSRRCVFVFGVDDGAVLKALGNYWDKRTEDDNREYLEKLFQAHVPVPAPKGHNVLEFIEKTLTQHRFTHPPPADLAKKIATLLEPNPRKIKNFINSLCATWQLFGGDKQQADTQKPPGIIDESSFAEAFVLIHYLRLYHKSVWRLLERQPAGLKILTEVLHGVDIREDPGAVDPEHRSLRELFSRAFIHVLSRSAEDAQKGEYRGMKLDDAVQLFQERIDRRRSDLAFIEWYKTTFDMKVALPDNFLYLPEVSTPDNPVDTP